MNVQLTIFDVTARKHQGNEESKAANLRAIHGKDQSRANVYAALLEAGSRGRTVKEIAHKLGKEMHCISGRVTELKAAGLVVATSVVRDRGRVLIASKFAPAGNRGCQ